MPALTTEITEGVRIAAGALWARKMRALLTTLGIVIGIVMGNIVTLITGGQFLIPWNWIALSFVVCLLTGLLSGLYPAVKAARLDPIESLRYE